MTADDLKEEFPEHAKMFEHSEQNWAVREFIQFLREQGVFLARYNATRHAIEALGEVLPEGLLMKWRGVDPAAYMVERAALDKRYHLEPLRKAMGLEEIEPVQQLGEIGDEVEVNLAQAWRFGVVPAASYAALRMLLGRSRKLYPDISPRFKIQGNQTIYTAGELRAWYALYQDVITQNRSESYWAKHPRAAKPAADPVERGELGDVRVRNDHEDAVAMLFSKIGEGKTA